MSTIRNKQRLIHLYRYLMRNTDEEHQATTNDLVEYLKQEDANASRKTVKDDIEVLIEEGVDIVVNKSFYNSYFVGSRKFEMPEIRLLVEGIIPNKTISGGKKREIVDKLLSLLSVHQAEKIGKHLLFGNNPGSMSEQLYYSIDKITDAVNEDRKIEFQYNDPAAPGSRTAGGDRKRIVMTPVMLRSNHNHYYACGYCGDGKDPAVFRLDCMTRVRVLEEKGELHPDRKQLESYLKSLFHMQTGLLADVTLECKDELAPVIRDRFGENADIWRSTQDSFYVRARISVSPAFFGWAFRYGTMIRIVSPASVREEYVKRAKEIIEASGT